VSDVELTTPRLRLSVVQEADIDGLLAVALSNPEFLASHEGVDGLAGHYDQAMLERDLAIADMQPGRYPLAVRMRADDQVVGWAEVLEEHPEDRLPWIGLLEIRADRQRQGYGRESAEAMCAWAGERGARAVRLAVDLTDERAGSFWARLGFTEVARSERSSPAGKVVVRVLELALHAG
jgi:RimJ/RimL family protein N-acetyltransferase